MRALQILGLLIMCFVISFAIAAIARNHSAWLKERHRQIWSRLCDMTGGTNFEVKSAWEYGCAYEDINDGKIKSKP